MNLLTNFRSRISCLNRTQPQQRKDSGAKVFVIFARRMKIVAQIPNVFGVCSIALAHGALELERVVAFSRGIGRVAVA